jgi:transposase
MRAMPAKYDKETIARAVRMYSERRAEFPEESQSASTNQVSTLTRIPADTIKGWVRRAEVDGGSRSGVTTDQLVELKRLRRENTELRRANAILKSASAFFAAELDRPST